MWGWASVLPIGGGGGSGGGGAVTIVKTNVGATVITPSYIASTQVNATLPISGIPFTHVIGGFIYLVNDSTRNIKWTGSSGASGYVQLGAFTGIATASSNHMASSNGGIDQLSMTSSVSALSGGAVSLNISVSTDGIATLTTTAQIVLSGYVFGY